MLSQLANAHTTERNYACVLTYSFMHVCRSYVCMHVSLTSVKPFANLEESNNLFTFITTFRCHLSIWSCVKLQEHSERLATRQRINDSPSASVTSWNSRQFINLDRCTSIEAPRNVSSEVGHRPFHCGILGHCCVKISRYTQMLRRNMLPSPSGIDPSDNGSVFYLSVEPRKWTIIIQNSVKQREDLVRF